MNDVRVDAYLRDGCGRCENYGTPACKVHLWTPILMALRELVVAAGLTEDLKWGSPCYTIGGKNVAMIVSLKDYCALQFFKGAALEDVEGVLERPGESSRYVRLLKFRTLADLRKRRAVAKKLLAQAIALEEAGTKFVPKAADEPIPVELERALAKNGAARKAFDALTPGRRRSHILHVSGAKQASTRETRAERVLPVILSGRGFNERES